MRIGVVYFGILREMAGHEREAVDLADGARLGELYADLQERIPGLSKFANSLALSINYEYSGLDAPLHDGDEVALLPPVSGGAGDASEAAENPALHTRLVREPINYERIVSELKAPEDGAVVVFDGIVRNHSRGRRTLYLEYSAYEPMAAAELEKLAQAALANYPIRDLRIVHRLGTLQIGESSVLIVVSSAHRAAAFDAARWIIDTLKKTVPIWKKEYFEDGAVWADGEPFPPEVSIFTNGTSK
ncbi:MAG: molybdenum cofactor biosynthesis protein MoaE [Candidatus Korobacteraceae bacterium]